MVSEHILAIDAGLSFCKTVVSTSLGRLVASASSPTPVLRFGPGRSEIDPAELWQVVAELIRKAVWQLPAEARIIAVGVSGHGNGAYFLDTYGQPLASQTASRSSAKSMCISFGWVTPLAGWLRVRRGCQVPDSAYAARHRFFYLG